MKNIKTLIKLASHKTDTIRLKIARFETRKQEIRDDLKKLEDRHVREMTAAEDINLRQFIGSYLEYYASEKYRLNKNIKSIDDQLVDIRKILFAAYQEQKKLETLKENQDLAKKKRSEKLEQQELDEISSIKHYLKNSP